MMRFAIAAMLRPIVPVPQHTSSTTVSGPSCGWGTYNDRTRKVDALARYALIASWHGSTVAHSVSKKRTSQSDRSSVYSLSAAAVLT
eukprot:scaffold79579_cov28-Tisochrysis_lutea.AAC.3